MSPSLRRLLGPRLARTPLQRDTIPLACDDGRVIEVLRVRDPRAKRMRLSVAERGARLTLPPAASDLAGQRFLHEHRAWLVAQLDAQRVDGIEPLVAFASTTLPLRGSARPLSWHAGRYARIDDDGDTLRFTVPARVTAATVRRALRDFYETEARADVGRWLPRYLPGLPTAPARIRIRPMSSQWGSLASNGVLALDLALVLGRPQAFEYVLVHELCHLVHADHSRAFWREVEARFQAWRDERDYFHAEGRRLKTALHLLLAG
ncbi:M48 family metallopeptidase [Luteimonas yindakuii]|uniref:YgjP family zinc-dependent metalloprotease n=1 Tax=Luteimonas yindakuii TaxID=2565782 RepID=UPI0010A2F06D|nr:SprT family zinc-dependent metalloprotease [Luteimonas yindakuii]QCO68633.1 M48 family metallopeptidase [Luteimonas yindakuii]